MPTCHFDFYYQLYQLFLVFHLMSSLFPFFFDITKVYQFQISQVPSHEECTSFFHCRAKTKRSQRAILRFMFNSFSVVKWSDYRHLPTAASVCSFSRSGLLLTFSCLTHCAVLILHCSYMCCYFVTMTSNHRKMWYITLLTLKSPIILIYTHKDNEIISD